MQHYKIKLDLKEMYFEFVGWIHLAWDKSPLLDSCDNGNGLW
jgi:hypothetical protein